MHAFAGTGKIQDPERVVTRTGSAALLFPFGSARCGQARSNAILWLMTIEADQQEPEIAVYQPKN